MDSIQNDHAFTARELKGTKPEPTYAGALSFLRRRYTRDLAGVDVAVTGIPLDTATTNRPRSRRTPMRSSGRARRCCRWGAITSSAIRC
jgi:agmatinase